MKLIKHRAISLAFFLTEAVVRIVEEEFSFGFSFITDFIIAQKKQFVVLIVRAIESKHYT